MAIAAQESGGIYEYDNEITPPGHGYGIMQITWPGNLGWGSNLKCYSEDCECYTNTPQGIYANIKDGLRVLQWAFSNEYAYKNGDETAYVSPDGLSFSNNDVRIIIAVWKYNGGGDPHYLQRVAEKLERNEGKSTVENDFGVSYDNLDLTNDLVEKLKYAQNHKIEMFIYSPVRPKIYDSQSSITGLVNSEIKEEIPYSCYNNTRIIIFFTNDTYNYEVLGMDEGTYGLLITSVKNGTLINFTAIDIPTNKCEVHTYSIDWNALSRGEKAVTITIDREGDGKVDYTIRSNGTFTKEKYDAAIKDDGDGKNGESDSLLFVQIGPLPLIGYIGIAAVIAMVGFVPVKKKAKGKTEAGMTPATVPSQQPQPPQLPPAQPPQQPPPQQYDQPQQYQQYAQAPQVPSQEIRMQADGTWVCSQCDNKIPGKFIFCTECGFKKGDGKTGG